MLLCEKCGREIAHHGALKNHRRFCERTLDEAKKDDERKIKLITEHGHRCWGCSLSEWRGKPIPLTLEHKDGDSDNNTRENLELLCPNCHAQTDTFCGKNIGKGLGVKRHAKYMKYRNI